MFWRDQIKLFRVHSQDIDTAKGNKQENEQGNMPIHNSWCILKPRNNTEIDI